MWEEGSRLIGQPRWAWPLWRQISSSSRFPTNQRPQRCDRVLRTSVSPPLLPPPLPLQQRLLLPLPTPTVAALPPCYPTRTPFAPRASPHLTHVMSCWNRLGAAASAPYGARGPADHCPSTTAALPSAEASAQRLLATRPRWTWVVGKKVWAAAAAARATAFGSSPPLPPLRQVECPQQQIPLPQADIQTGRRLPPHPQQRRLPPPQSLRHRRRFRL